MDPSFFEHLETRGWAAEMDWLRRLAASLVRDPEEAADLAGEVWVQALERRPAVGESRPLRAWLTVVARRLAARKRRENGARREREERRARPESVPPANEAIERVELQRKLVEAVLALDEPYRSAVVLRHLEQLDSAEIARRQKCTNEVARQRVARGLQQLRARLDRDFGGGRESWRALFVPFAAHVPLAGGAAVGSGLIVSAKVVGGALACAAAALLLWLLPLELFRSGSTAPREVALAAFEPSAPQRSAVEPPAAGARDPALPDSHRPRLAGRVVDARGEPLAGVSLSLVCEREPGALEARSDAAGRFEAWPDFELHDAAFVAHASLADFTNSHVDLNVGEEALIVMHRLPRVEVRVVDADGSAPESSGCVRLVLVDQAGKSRTTSLSLEEDGVARSDTLHLGRLGRVFAAFDGFALYDSRRSDELTGDTVLRIDVTLSRGTTLRGVVLDERTRLPVARALVSAVPFEPNDLLAPPSATTDARGRFELRGVTASRRMFSRGVMTDLYLVNVDAKGFSFPPERRLVWQHAATAPPPMRVDDLELQLLLASCSLTVTLQWPDGNSSASRTIVQAYDRDGNTFQPEQGTSNEFEFRALPAGDVRVIAQEPHSLATAEVSLLPAENRALVLAMRRADAALEVFVRDPRGRGVAGVHLRYEGFAEQSGARTALEDWNDVTDEQGRARFESLYPSACLVSAWNEEGSSTSLGFWPPALRFELEEGAVAVADFVAEPAVPYAGRLEPAVAIGSSGPVLLQLTHAQFGVVCSLFVHEDGRFSFPGIFGADYVLVAKQGEVELGRLAVSRTGSSELVVPIAR